MGMTFYVARGKEMNPLHPPPPDHT